MEIFNFAFGPYPQRVNIYLAEKRPADVAVTLYGGPDRAANVPPIEIKGLTPKGSLPVLKDADGTIIGQSLAILEYIEDKVPEPDMRGGTPAQRARVREITLMLDEAMTFFGLWARHGSLLGHGAVPTSLQVAQICAARYFDQLRLIDTMLGDAPYLVGPSVTLADCVAMATLQYAHDFYGVPIPPDCIKLQRWFDSFSQRPSAVRPPYPEERRVVAYGLMQQTGVTTMRPPKASSVF